MPRRPNHKLTAEQAHFLSLLRSEMKAASVVKTLRDLSRLKVLVVGEPIVDRYIFCETAGISSKSPTVSARYLYHEDYAGGALAIANHLAALGLKPTYLATHGGEDYFKKLTAEKLHKNVVWKGFALKGIPTPLKTRYMVEFRTQRMFEVLNLSNDQWETHRPTEFCRELAKQAARHDLMIVADFGHGLFEREVLGTVNDLKIYKALNVQTNSGNFGYNVYSKHKRFDYLCIDEREFRLAHHDRFTPVMDLMRTVINTQIRRPVSVTLGTRGSLYFDDEQNEHRCPVFANNLVDSTGAGDAYFTVSSLVAHIGANPMLVPFLGNCYAGIKTAIMGNKRAVSQLELVSLVKSLFAK